MKIVLVLAVVLVCIWLFRLNRRPNPPRAGGQAGRPAGAPAAMALDMVRCSQCDVHLPKADAVEGRDGVYCSLEHRVRAES